MWRLGESGFKAEFLIADAREKLRAKPFGSILAPSMPAMKKIAAAADQRVFIRDKLH
jgi:hypothetical protein